MTDQIDLSNAVIHGSPDIRTWPITVDLVGVEFKAGTRDDSECGVRPIGNMAKWPDVIPPGWDGPIYFCLWIFVKVRNVWHGAGVMEFYRGKTWTGAPPVTQWGDWFYGDAWGSELRDARPQYGTEVAFMVASGSQRLKDVIGVRGRSQVMRVTLAKEGVSMGMVPTEPEPVPIPTPMPVPVPTPAPTPPPIDVVAVVKSIVAPKIQEIYDYIINLEGRIDKRLTKLEAQPVPTPVPPTPTPTLPRTLKVTLLGRSFTLPITYEP